MSYATIEARAIPALKELAAKYAEVGEASAKQQKAERQKKAKAVLKRELKGILPASFINAAEIEVSYGEIQFSVKGKPRIDVMLGRDPISELGIREGTNEIARECCRKKSKCLEMTTSTGRLRNLASYMRTNCGKTADVLALPQKRFNALLRRYIEDLCADTTCYI